MGEHSDTLCITESGFSSDFQDEANEHLLLVPIIGKQGCYLLGKSRSAKLVNPSSCNTAFWGRPSSLNPRS